MILAYINVSRGLSKEGLWQALGALGFPKEEGLTVGEVLRQYGRCEAIYNSPLPMHRGYADDIVKALEGLPLETVTGAIPAMTVEGIQILKSIATHFGESPVRKIEKSGFGDGLQILIGEGFPTVQIETNIDDMNPEWFDYVMEMLLKMGVVDVALQPIQMKQNRPGTLLKVIAPWDLKDKAIEIILRETTSLGVRYFPLERKILTRELKTVETRFGPLPVKIAKEDHWKIEKWIPEYKACREIAKARNIPIAQVYEEVLRQRNRHD